jgi:two-component system LytT family response regulator
MLTNINKWPAAKKIQTVLIDDEFSALKTLGGMLEQYCPQIKVVAHAASVGEGTLMLNRHKPELVFLDIEMPPGGNAFDLLQQTTNLHFGVIFTTAYHQYAVEAINKAQPWAYLIKPFSVDALRDAVKSAHEKLLSEQQRVPEITDHTGIVIHDSRKGMIVLRFQDILFCQSDGAVVEITTLKNNKLEKTITYRTLKELEQDFANRPFCRTHHGYIVNMIHIDRVEKTGRNGVIHLTNGIQVAISVQRMGEFEQKFEAFLQGA